MALRFRLFGFPVEVRGSALLFALLLGMYGARQIERALQFAVIVIVSLLVHELGHAFAARRFGFEPSIVLGGLGGLTHWPQVRDVGRWRSMLVTGAGPFAGFCLGLVCLAIAVFAPAGSPGLREFFQLAALANFVWTALNLIPVLPYDGGQLMLTALGPQRQRLAAGLSLGFAVAAAAFLASRTWYLAAVFVVVGGVTSFFAIQRSNAERPDQQQLDELLAIARRALDRGAYAEAFAAARPVTAFHVPLPTRQQAAQIAAWAALLAGNAGAARMLLHELPDGAQIDPYLQGAVLDAEGDAAGATAVLGAAHDSGDTRNELRGLLVKSALAAGQGARAVAVAAQLGEALSDDDRAEIVARARTLGADTAPLEFGAGSDRDSINRLSVDPTP